MSYYHDHVHIAPERDQYTSGTSPDQYGSVVGTIEQNTEKPITGRNGDHLQFDVSIGNGVQYTVDVNTQSRDGSEIGVYIATQALSPTGPNPDEPLGPPAYGMFPDAKLSYAAIGLTDADFTQMPYYRIDSQLSAALGASEFVSVYGLIFDDRGQKGIHETHYTGRANQDGAIAIYTLDSTTNQPSRTWFYFKFQEDTIGQPESGQASEDMVHTAHA